MATREYAIECELASGDVWTPVGLYAIDGVNQRVIRCSECGLRGSDAEGGLTCRRWPESIHSTDPHGFCSWAEVMSDGDQAGA